jgi:hypothetical protein
MPTSPLTATNSTRRRIRRVRSGKLEVISAGMAMYGTLNME